MARDRALERLRGFYDSWIGDEENLLGLQASLLHMLWLHGYRRIDVPIVEQAELFLRKNGVEMATKLYSFTDLGRREVALRPEFTASIIRAAAEHHRDGPWPLHLAYCGPVFRYQRPQRGTSRQFQQVGAELLGAAGVTNDIEMIRLACTMTEACGVTDYHLVLGHLGMVNALLDRLGIEGHVQQFIVSNLEYYNRGPREKADIHERLGLAPLPVDADDGPPADSDQATDETRTGVWPYAPTALTAVGGADVEEMLSRVLAGLEVNLSNSTRTPEEIVARLLRKAQRQDQSEGIRQALDFVARLGTIQGPPDEALVACGALLREAGLDEAPLENLRAIVKGLGAAGFDWKRGAIHLGMARGIPYYTGMIFELHSAGSAPLQLCGGGRYDGLARTLTGRLDVPALGFAFGVERLALVMAADQRSSPHPPPAVVYTLSGGARGLATRAATALRAAGLAAEMDPEPRTVRAALTRTRRLGYRFAVMAGEKAGESDPHGNVPPRTLTGASQCSPGDADGGVGGGSASGRGEPRAATPERVAPSEQEDLVDVYDVSNEAHYERIALAILPHLLRDLQTAGKVGDGVV